METLGSAIDKLVVVNLKIFQLEDIKRVDGADDKTIADATRKTNKLNKHRNDLIGEIDKMFGHENAISIKTHG